MSSGLHVLTMHVASGKRVSKISKSLPPCRKGSGDKQNEIHQAANYECRIHAITLEGVGHTPGTRFQVYSCEPAEVHVCS